MDKGMEIEKLKKKMRKEKRKGYFLDEIWKRKKERIFKTARIMEKIKEM